MSLEGKDNFFSVWRLGNLIKLSFIIIRIKLNYKLRCSGNMVNF